MSNGKDKKNDAPVWLAKVKAAQCPIDVYADAFTPPRCMTFSHRRTR